MWIPELHGHGPPMLFSYVVVLVKFCKFMWEGKGGLGAPCPGCPVEILMPHFPAFARLLFFFCSQRIHVQVLHGFDPALVCPDGQRSDRPQAGGRIWKNAYH